MSAGRGGLHHVESWVADHTYAAYLADPAGFEVELVADAVPATDATRVVPTRAGG